MELDQFIKNTLVALAKGVHEANEATQSFRKESLKHSPLFVIQQAPLGSTEGRGTVTFDVAVTVVEGDVGKGGGGIRVAGIGFGAEKEKSTVAGQESRIRFHVDVSEYIS